jgi:peptidoglycan/LPS O-acetylase OafA/YrhL
MMLAVLQPMGVRAYAIACVPLAVVCYFIVSTPIAGAPTTSPSELREALFKAAFYAVIATLMVAPLALGDRGPGTRNSWPAGRWSSSARSPTRSS